MATNSKTARGDIYTIKNLEHRDDIWLRLGSAWVNKDLSLGCLFDAVPVDGRFHIRPPKDEAGNEVHVGNHGDRLVIYTIKDTDEGRTIWTEIGVAWVNRDHSLNGTFEALPIAGKCHIRPKGAKNEK